MPKRVEITTEWATSGIDITWTPTAQCIDIGGWYDSHVSIEGRSFTLHQFFSELGITEKDCTRAFQRPS